MKKIPVFFDTSRRLYWIQNARQEWLAVGESGIRRELRIAGFTGYPQGEEGISALDREISRITKEQDVCFAGPLAGWPAGFHQLGAQRVLVTTGPKLVDRVRGRHALMEEFLGGLLPEEQLLYFLGWLKSALVAIETRSFAPGQLLVLAGPQQCGKSLLQNLLTELIGARSAKPYRYMTGATTFNSELFAAEHLMIEDEASATDYKSRRHFAATLKQFLHSETHSFHAKGRDAITLRCFWRLTVSVNEEPENLLVLPPIDEDLAGKIMLLKCGRPDCLPDAGDPASWVQFRRQLSAELPAFVDWLKGEFRLPKRIKETLAARRFGVDAYQHPELLEALTSLTPQTRMLNLMDSWEVVNGCAWEGTAEQLETKLRKLDTNRECDRLFNFANACGTFLGRLRRDHPGRVSSRVLHGKTLWKVEPLAA